MSTLLTTLLNALHSKAGTLVQWAVGSLIGWGVAKLADAGLEIPADVVTQMEAALVMAGAFVVSSLVQYLQAKYAIKVQTAVGAKPDARIRAETLKQVGRLIDAASAPKK